MYKHFSVRFFPISVPLLLLLQYQQIQKIEILHTSTTDELLTARAINFPSVVNFFILLKETRSDMSTSRDKKRCK